MGRYRIASRDCFSRRVGRLLVMKKPLKFSSHVRYVCHGVDPIAQLFKVPRTLVPVVSAVVRSRGSPAAGPAMFIGVMPVIRRANGEGRTTSHSPLRRLGSQGKPVRLVTSMIE